MTKIAIISDIHHRAYDQMGIPDNADIYIIAGDVDSGTYGCSYIDWRFVDKEVIYVPGNHEYYGHEYHSLRDDMLAYKWQSIKAGGCFDNSVYYNVRRKIRFICATLWSDSTSLPFMFNPNDRMDVMMLERSIGDFRYIHHGDDIMSLCVMSALHAEAKEFLLREISTPYAGKTIVVTHFAPSPKSIAPKYERDPLTAYFVNDLPEEYFRGVDIFVHGHTHTAFDYMVGDCRVICSPRGYRNEIPNFEVKMVNI